MVDRQAESVNRRTVVKVSGAALIGSLAANRAQAQAASESVATARESDLAAPAEVKTVAVGAAEATGADLAANVKFTPAGTLAVVRSVQDKERDVVSVKDFGAVGDGSDETAKIQAAIDAIVATGGGMLLFPTCSVCYGFTNLKVGHRVILCGQGFTEFSTVPPPAYLKKLGTGVGITITGDCSGFDKMHVDGNGTAGDLIQVLGGRFVLRDTSLVQAGQDNLRIGTDLTVHAYNMNLWRISNLISLDAGRYGLHVHDACVSGLPDVNAGALFGCDVRGCANHAIYFEQAWDCSLYGVTAQKNGGTGLRYGALSRNIVAIAPYLEANANSEFVAVAGNVLSRIIGNRSGVNQSGYVDHTIGGVDMLQTRAGVDGYYHHRSIRVANFAAGQDALVNLWAGVNENQAGALAGRAGTVGSSGEMAIQVKRDGNTPADRLRLTDGAVVVPTGTDFQADALKDQSGAQLVGSRVTGFGAMTGTATKTAIATYTAPYIEATYNEATIQALAEAVQALSRRVKAQDDALIAHGLIGT